MPITEVEGLRLGDLRRQFEQLKDGGQDIAGGELKARTLDIVAESKKRAPRLTGNLEQAHYVKQARGLGGRFTRRYEAGVDTDKAPYAVYMHDGWDFRDDPYYKLGAGSMAKNAGPPHGEPEGVGLKFFDRGVEAAMRKETLPTMTARIYDGLLRFLGIRR